jgi:hypothetical protein
MVSDVKKRLMTVVVTFAAGTVIVVAALTVIDVEATSPEMADGAALVAAIFGTIGLLLALRWWSTAGEIPRDPNRLQLGFIVRVAIAESGLLLGALGYIMTGSLLAPIVGGGLFLGALGLMALGLNRITAS